MFIGNVFVSESDYFVLESKYWIDDYEDLPEGLSPWVVKDHFNDATGFLAWCQSCS